MFKYKSVNQFFFCCTLLFIGGEIHRTFISPENNSDDNKSIVEKESPSENIPHKILENKSEYIFPVPGKSRKNLIGFFGDPRGGGKRKHQGIDVAAKRGTPVVAVTDGTVAKVKEGGNGGKQVWMKDSENKVTFFYGHLHSQSVRPGQKVKQGDELGTVGSTGNASGGSPHLHFEILMEGRKAVDPLSVLP